MCTSNAELKKDVLETIKNYEESNAKYCELKSQNQQLEAEAKSKEISKKLIIDLLKQKVSAQGKVTKEIENKFQKEKSLDVKSFISEFMKERKEYHRLEIFKHKV